MTLLSALLSVPGAQRDELSTPTSVLVSVAQWESAAHVAHAAGARRAEWLTAAQFDTDIRVAVLLRATEDVILATSISDGAIASLSGIWSSLVWHERECAEMFGINFLGHPGLAPLLLSDDAPPAPLLRTVPLLPRMTQLWPGAVTATGAALADGPARGRRAIGLAPGVRAEWLAEPDTGAPKANHE